MSSDELTYSRSAEWRQAEEAMTVRLGFRVVRTPEITFQGVTSPERFKREWMDYSGEKPKVSRLGDSSRLEWDLWCEAVRMRIEAAGAAKLAWDLYAAATGVTMKSFNGMPADEPVAHVRAERKRLLDAARPRKPINVIFDGPPGPVCGRFIEVEDDERRSLNAGEWMVDGRHGEHDTWWKLRITELPPA